MDALLDACQEGSFVIAKVKGHASIAADVRRGRVAMEDKVGNDGADALAVAGAASHALPPEAVRQVKARQLVITKVQQMMVEILIARGAQQGNTATQDQPKHRCSSSVSM